ncbi:uncharacterized protein A4U43_C06F10740, partial [Asparagus officinalis]
VMHQNFGVLLVSQFTLYGVLKGNKPDFHVAMPPEKAKVFYASLVDKFRKSYSPDAVQGFAEISKGCCGSGTIEFGQSCKGQKTCDDPTKFMYWDAIHPTQQMYKILADEGIKEVAEDVLV